MSSLFYCIIDVQFTKALLLKLYFFLLSFYQSDGKKILFQGMKKREDEVKGKKNLKGNSSNKQMF